MILAQRYNGKKKLCPAFPRDKMEGIDREEREKTSQIIKYLLKVQVLVLLFVVLG